MRYLRLTSSQLSRIHKTLHQNPNLRSRPHLSSHFGATYTTDAPEKRQPPPENVSAIGDKVSGLTPLEISDLTEVLRKKLGIKEMPGMGIGGLRRAEKVEEKKEKTAFDLKLDSFDAAAKIKVIEEVRTFTALGLKEAKDLVEKAPTLLKKGVTKEEAESIMAKMKEIGAVVSME
ncbi:hypothetical protein ACLB2K_008379 [Fragaria x ananassa]